MRAGRAIAVAAAVAGAGLVALGVPVGADGGRGDRVGHGHGHGSHGPSAENGELAAVRSATARFHRSAVAEAEGYGVLTDAAGRSCIEDPNGTGGMGTHLVNGGLVGDGVVDAEHPEALLYDVTGPNARLLGVEYVVFVSDWGATREPPRLFGQEFHLVQAGNRYGLPPFYALHAWTSDHNPLGDFHDWNPTVGC